MRNYSLLGSFSYYNIKYICEEINFVICYFQVVFSDLEDKLCVNRVLLPAFR